jgi:hypothetical protein
VRYGPGEWALYFDVDDNGLQGVIGEEMLRMEVELVRKEQRQGRMSKDPEAKAEAETPRDDDDDDA